ncbi:photosynthetic reaction center cytochrome c subunit family protein [Methylocystis sp. SC2]|uniref:photosynthetic reaction center cytochrome c subunit family protein n=1 Tax=Methylocystis sp. (strain SC2) TaxID=187303 RepID=UPI00130E0987|nr:photosynthetic reaction center cytochrome c subunit family protein [Methylocystis sp. SC2]
MEWLSVRRSATTALKGLQMMREVNAVYFETLNSLNPVNCLGPLSAGAKDNCGTCHLGVSKPL